MNGNALGISVASQSNSVAGLSSTMVLQLGGLVVVPMSSLFRERVDVCYSPMKVDLPEGLCMGIGCGLDMHHSYQIFVRDTLRQQ